MKRHKTTIAYACIAVGIAFVLVVSALTLFAESSPANLVLLSSGVVLLFVALIVVQLSLWREGQASGAAAANRLAPVTAAGRQAPPQLKHRRFRDIWENMEETRRLMESRAQKDRHRERLLEKKRLDLPEEETILFMEERTWLSLWPVGILSLICIASSNFVSEMGVLSFVWLALGLGGLLFVAAFRSRKKYYLTNFRVLVRRKSVFKRTPHWSAMLYQDVERCWRCRALGGSKLALVAKQGTLIIEGLTRPRFEALAGILREKLPAAVEGPLLTR